MGREPGGLHVVSLCRHPASRVVTQRCVTTRTKKVCVGDLNGIGIGKEGNVGGELGVYRTPYGDGTAGVTINRILD